MIKRTIGLVGLAAVALYALSVHAQSATETPGCMHHRGHHMGGGPGRLIPLLLRSTDLTPDQEKQVHQILDADRPAVQELFTQLHQAKDDLATLMLGPQEPQADTVSAKLASIAQLQQQLAQHEAATVTKIRGVLTPEQLAKALAAKDQKPAWHGRKFHPMQHDD
jgi:Spy/CpxP family protein refolding chaperone